MPPLFNSILASYDRAKSRLFLLDYDGTLAAFASAPELAAPSQRTMSVLAKLASNKKNNITIITGRSRTTLDEWFKGLSLNFIAEYGAFVKQNGKWQAQNDVMDVSWRQTTAQIMQPYLEYLPGSLIEEKETALVFHYRGASIDAKNKKITSELSLKLRAYAEKEGLKYLHHKKNMEIRQSGAEKAHSAKQLIDLGAYGFVLCAGDSQDDEDMFEALKTSAVCIKVGQGKTAAKYKVKNPALFIGFLEQLADKA